MNTKQKNDFRSNTAKKRINFEKKPARGGRPDNENKNVANIHANIGLILYI